jgi:DsbC/DsbD-like thiol-disulfide interchange protein
VKRSKSHFAQAFSSLTIFITCGICFLLCGSTASAQSTHIPHGTIELISEENGIAPSHAFTLGFKFKMDSGWHIYWVNPGDSGEPPRLTWQLPAGLTAGEIKWPAPRKMGASTIVNYVYDGEVLLMVPVRAAADVSASSSEKLGASVKFLICSDQMCVPGHAELSLALPVKVQVSADAATAGLFAAARARLPKAAPANWKFSGHSEKDSFVIDIQAGGPIRQGYFFPLQESQIDNAAAQIAAGRPSGLRLTLRKSNELTKPLSNLKGVLELPDGQAYIVDVPISTAAHQ